MAMGDGLPIAIRPGVIAELWRVLELLFRDARAETFQRRIVLQGSPRNRIVAVAEPKEAAEAHDGIDDPSG